MNILSFVLGIAVGIIFVMTIALGMGIYVRHHPQLVVRKIMAGMSNRAPSRRY